MKKSLYSAIFLTLLASASVATAQIQMTFSIVQPTCHGFTNGSAIVFAVGGTGSYSYLWSTGQTTQTTFGIGKGTYTVTVTDAVQNSAIGQIAVSEPSAVMASITAINLNCAGNNGTLTANGFGGTPPYTFAWDGPGGPSLFKSIPVVAPGNYFVTVTDANHCSGVGSFTVDPPLTVEVTATDIPCSTYPQGGSANAVATGGKAPYAYSWSNGQHTSLITNLSQGIYFCTVTGANGCIAIDSDTVDIPPALEVIVTWLSPSCGFSNNGTATVQASGGTPPYTYNWPSPLPSGPSQTGLAPGPYYVCTFDSNLCQKDLWVNIPHITGLNVQLVVTSATCIGINNATATAVVTPPGSNYVYQWNILPPDSNVVQVTGLAAGTLVSVTVTDTVSGCTGTASGIVGAHTTVDIAVTDVDILCAGGFGSATAVASNGTPQYSYTWFNNNDSIGNTASIDGLQPGAYLVSVVDSLGCKAQAVADISIQSAPNAVIDGGHVLVCGDSLSVVQFINQSTDPYNAITNLVWTVTGPNINTVINQQSQITLQLPVDDTITVQLIATSGLGCSDTATLVYNVPGIPDFTISLDSSTINCMGDSIRINVIGDTTYNYVWNPAVTPAPNPLSVLVYPTVNTTYVLTVTDGNACTATGSITIQPAGGLFQLLVSETLIRICEDSVELFASTIPVGIATIKWYQGNTQIGGNPVTVPATPTTTIYTVKAYSSDSCFLKQEVSVTGYAVEVNIDPNAVTSVCEDSSLILSVIVTPPSDSLTYLWSVNAPATLSDSTSANPVLSGPPGVYTVTVIVTNVICSDTVSFPVQIIPGFYIDPQISIDLCIGLEVHFFNGIGGTWNFGDTSATSMLEDPVHTYAAAGQYHVVFTPSQQCAIPWDSTITVHTFPLEASINHNYVNCVNQAEIQFTGSSNYPDADIVAWAWTFSNGTPASASVQNPIVTYTQEGTVTATLVVRDINGCLDTVSLPVEVKIINDNIPNAAVICPGDSVQLNPDGHDLGAAYTWVAVPTDTSLFGQENDPNPVVKPSVPTTYTVTLSQDSCSGTYIVQVTFKPGGQVSLPDDFTVCSDSTVSLTAQSNGATGYEWSINPDFDTIFDSTQTVKVLPPGTFYVRTTGGVCTAVDSVHIGLSTPVVQIAQTTDIPCPGGFGSATAVASNGTPLYDYAWFVINGGQIGTTASVTGLVPGTYTILVTDAVGCTVLDTVEIRLLSAPTAAIDSTYVIECGDSLSTVTLSSLSFDPISTITSIEWFVNGTLVSSANPFETQLPVHQTDTLQLVAVSAISCRDTATLELYVPGIPDISISLDSTTLNCNGGPVALNVDGDSIYTYVWNQTVILNPDTLHVLVNPTVATTYILTATDRGFCTATDSIRVTPIDGIFQLIVSDSLIRICEDSVKLSASTIPPGITIEWSGPFGTVTANSIKVPATPNPTVYTVRAFSLDSCSRADTVVVTGFGLDVTIDPNAETSVCEDSSLTLSVIVTPPSSSLTYLWSVNAPATLSDSTSANPVLSGPPGVYTVTVIVTNVICSDTMSFPVEIIPGLDINAHISIDLCNGLEVGFNNDSIPGQWNFGDGNTSTLANPVHTYANPGQFTVTFTPNNLQCTSLWDSTITVHALPLAASINHDYIKCVDQAEIQFIGSSNYPSSDIVAWAWTFSSGTPASASVQNPIVTYTQEGTVTATLVVRDINGCLDTVSLPVEVKIINDNIPNAAAICPGDSVQLNPDGHDLGATYTWVAVPTDTSLFGQENDPNPVVKPNVPTTYTVTIGQDSCTGTYTVQVTFKPGGQVSLPDDFTVCNIDSVSITAQSNGATGYEWSIYPDFDTIFDSTQTVKVLPPGTFYVRTTGGVCTAVDSVHIGLSTPVVQIAQTTDIPCPSDFGSATAVASNGTPLYDYAWFVINGGQIGTTASVTGLVPGTYTILVTDAVGCTVLDTVEIRLLSAPNAAIDSTYVIECGDSLSTVTLNSLSSDAISTIASLEWFVNGTPVSSANPFETQLPVHQTDTVQLVAVSALGCRDTATLELYVPGIPDISVGLDSATLNCNGDPITLCISGGEPGYDYDWEPAVSPGSDSLCFTVDPAVPTTFVLTATDGNACTATASVAVQPIDSLELTLSQTLVQTCDDSVKIWATTNIPSTIVWTGPNGVVTSPGDTITVAATADTIVYTATATTAGSSTCTAVAQVEVLGQGVDVSLDPAAVDTVCAGLPLALSVNVVPLSVTYLWSVNAPATLTGAATPNPVLSGPAGNYTVSVTVANLANTDCKDSLEFPVAILDAVDLGADSQFICPGDSVQLNPNGTGAEPGASYHWTASPPDPTLTAAGNDNILNPTVSPDGPTTYTLAVGNGSSCPALFTVKVGLKPGAVLSATSDTTVCSNSLVSLTAQSNGATGYEWSEFPGFDTIFDSTQTVEVLPPGTFYVRSTGAACTAVDTVRVGLSTPEVLISQSSDVPCPSDFGSATAVASNGTPLYDYAWFVFNGGQIGATASITSLAPGTYTVAVEDAAGCKALDTVEIRLLSAPSAAIDSSFDLVCGDSLSTVSLNSLSSDAISTIASLEWFVNGTPVSSANPFETQLPVHQTDTLQLVAVSAIGCRDTATLELYVPGIPDISVGLDSATLNCNGDPITLCISGGEPGYDYDWEPAVSPGSDSLCFTVDPAVPTTFVLTATDGNACTAMTSVAVQPIDSLELTLSQTLVQTCDDSVKIWATTNIPAAIVWTGPFGTMSGDTITVPATPNATTYTATATASSTSTCTAVGQVSVTGQGVAVNLDPALVDTVCAGEPLALSVTAVPLSVTYLWSVNAPATLTGAATPNPVLSGPAGNYTVSVTVANLANTDCKDSLEFPVAILDAVDLGADSLFICPGDTVPLNANGTGAEPGASYHWTASPPDPTLTAVGNDNILNPTVSPDGPTTYTLAVGNGSSCPALFTVKVGLKPGAVLSATSDTTVCSNSFVSLTAQSNGATGYEWSEFPGFDTIFDSTQTVEVLPPGIFYVRTTGAACPAVDTVRVGLSTPEVLISQSSDVPCPSDFGSATAVASNGTPQYAYTWFNSNNDLIGAAANVTDVAPGIYTVLVTDSTGCKAKDTVEIRLLSAPSAAIDSSFDLVCGDSLSTVSLNSLSSDAISTIASLEWFINGTPVSSANPFVTQLPVHQTDTVQLVAVSAIGCRDTATLELYVPGIPDISVGLDSATLNCNGDPITLCISGGEPGYDYDWEPAVSPGSDPLCFTVDPAVPTTFVLTATDGNACTATASIAVQPIDSLELTLSQTLVVTCDDSVKIWATSNIPSTIIWTGPFGTMSGDTITVAATADTIVYTATATTAASSTCTAVAQVEVLGQGVDVSLDPAAVDTVCAGMPLALSVNVVPLSVTYLWSVDLPATLTGAATPNPVLSGPAGNYTVSVTVANLANTDCTDSLKFPVAILDAVDLGLDSLFICPGDSIQLNPNGTGAEPGAIYHWTAFPPDPTLVPGVKDNMLNPMVSPKVPTTYTLAINKGQLCPVSYRVYLGFKPGSDVHIVADSAMTVCSADLWTLSAQSSNATEFEWSSSNTFMPVFDTLQTVKVLPNGTYFVRTSGAVCSAMDSITIDLKIPEIQVIPADYDICLGEAAALMFTNLIPEQTLSCDWGPNLPMDCNLIVSPNTTTTYTVTVTNEFGCKDTLSFTVNVTAVSVDAVATPNVVTLEDPTTILTGTPGGNGTIISYEWTPPGTLSSPHTAETGATPTETTTYTIKVTTEDGCMAIDTVTVYFRHNECISPFVFIPKAFTPNNDQKNDFFIPRADGMTALKFIVWDRWGEIVYETNDPNALGWDGSYKGKEATPDAFAWYVWLTCGNGEIFEAKGNVTLLK